MLIFTADLLRRLPKCEEIASKPLAPKIDLTIIVDGSRDIFENMQLVSFIAESIDVSKYGSLLSIIHGPTGALVVNHTTNITRAFKQLEAALTDTSNKEVFFRTFCLE